MPGPGGCHHIIGADDRRSGCDVGEVGLLGRLGVEGESGGARDRLGFDRLQICRHVPALLRVGNPPLVVTVGSNVTTG